jgi:hypothetical protein
MERRGSRDYGVGTEGKRKRSWSKMVFRCKVVSGPAERHEAAEVDMFQG